MTDKSRDIDLKQPSAAKVARLFFGGVAAGSFTLLILYSFSFVELNWRNIGVATIVILLCGLLSSIWGIKFIDRLMDSLSSFGL